MAGKSTFLRQNALIIILVKWDVMFQQMKQNRMVIEFSLDRSL